MEKRDTVWQDESIATRYLEGLRNAIPCAAEQLKLMLFLIRHSKVEVKSFLDLGCGDGILGRMIFSQWPNAHGVFVDFSESMLDAARDKIQSNFNHEILSIDYGDRAWLDSVDSHAPFDVIVSGFSIHHQPDERKKELYRELYSLLSPGGVFLNLEHVSSQDSWVEKAFHEMFIDNLFEFHQKNGNSRTRQEIADEFYYSDDLYANILAPVDVQCNWLREIGFEHVDCYFKHLELALFGGVKAASL